MRLDRDDDTALAGLLREGFDLVVDCVAFGARHARQLVASAGHLGAALVLSSAAVYADDDGNTIGSPTNFPIPIPETQATVDPGLANHYAADKAALEQVLLDYDRLPTTILRTGAIYGTDALAPREWYFVRRALDGRPVRLLAFRGASRFHPLATANLAEVIRLAADRPATRVLNIADPEAPTVREIAAAIDDALGVASPVDVLLDAPPLGVLGATPWSLPGDVVLCTDAAADELGYRPVTGFFDSLRETVAWLAELADGGEPGALFPNLATWFDYPAEDRWLTDHVAASDGRVARAMRTGSR